MMFSKITQEIFLFRRPADDPAVFVRSGDLETALRILRRKVQKCGGLKALNIRKKYPSRKARRRVKDRKARQRFMRNKTGG